MLMSNLGCKPRNIKIGHRAVLWTFSFAFRATGVAVPYWVFDARILAATARHCRSAS